MSTQSIIMAQSVPYLLVVPLSALVFFISALAETGRTPFDLLEAESEIVAGFHVEYTGMKFGMFFLAEFVSTLFMSGLFAVIYLGGWNIPIINTIIRLVGGTPIDLTTIAFGRVFGLVIFFIKMFSIYMIFIWIRGTWPRMRIDQMLDFNWKFMVPLTLVMLLTVAVLDKLIPVNADPLVRAGIHLVSNILIGIGTLEILRRRGQENKLLALDNAPSEVELPPQTAAAD